MRRAADAGLPAVAMMRPCLAAAAVALALRAVPAGAQALGYLRGAGPKAAPVVALTWGLLILSIVVVVITSMLVLVGVLRRRVTTADISAVPVARSGSGMGWIAIGVGVSGVALIGALVWTVVVLAAVNGPSRPPSLTIEVTGQQWWWKARYLSSDPSQVFTTAGEIHIPAGEPVRIRLIGADVIHSFWVPALTGKMEAIPGQTNETWIEASKPGIFQGRCAEYCGAQHAHMAFLLIADTPPQFAAWRAAQLRPAEVTPQLAAGAHSFVYHCGACHTVRGTAAGGTVAPDLTHLMSRRILAGGVLPNSIGNLAGWIANPQDVKPGTHMPTLYLSGPQLQGIVSFLETLS